MSVHDRCRLCNENLRINGYIGNSKKIFHKDVNEKSIDERLTELGLKLLNVQDRPCRICRRCFRLIGRLEDCLATFRGWQKAEGERSFEHSTSTTETSVSAKAPVTLKRERVPSPPKLLPRPRSPTAPPAYKLLKPTTENRTRQSVTEVVIYYPSRPKGDRIVCQDSTAGIVEAIAKDNWSGAAKQLTRHKDLFGPLSENILRIIEDECKKICSPFTDFMLSKSSAEDLKAFSLEKLQADLQRVSPFLFSIFLRVTKQSANTACAAAAIALRGREPRLSAFSHYVNSVLQQAGVKKAAFNRLCKLGITTSYSNAVKKQMELANTCREDFQILKVTNEVLVKEEDEDISIASDVFVKEEDDNISKSNEVFVKEEDDNISKSNEVFVKEEDEDLSKSSEVYVKEEDEAISVANGVFVKEEVGDISVAYGGSVPESENKDAEVAIKSEEAYPHVVVTL